MKKPKFTRRSVIYGGALLSLAGLGIGSGTQLSEPTFETNYTTHLLEQPVVSSGPTPSSGPPFFARTITTQKQADSEFRTELLEKDRRKEWESIDYAREFVAVFISRYFVTPPGTVNGKQPLSKAGGDTFRFEVDSTEVSYQPRERLFTQIERWDKNGTKAQKRAEVVITFD